MTRDTAEPIAISIPDAAARTGVGRSLLYAEMSAGRLAFAKLGKRRVIPLDALKAWLAAATQKAA